MPFDKLRTGGISRRGFDRLSLSVPWEMTNSTNPAQAELVEAPARTKVPS